MLLRLLLLLLLLLLLFPVSDPRVASTNAAAFISDPLAAPAPAAAPRHMPALCRCRINTARRETLGLV